MLPGSSQHPPTGLHWHGVLQTFGEHQILAPAGDEAHAGSVETTKEGCISSLDFSALLAPHEGGFPTSCAGKMRCRGFHIAAGALLPLQGCRKLGAGGCILKSLQP